MFKEIFANYLFDRTAWLEVSVGDGARYEQVNVDAFLGLVSASDANPAESFDRDGVAGTKEEKTKVCHTVTIPHPVHYCRRRWMSSLSSAASAASANTRPKTGWDDCVHLLRYQSRCWRISRRSASEGLQKISQTQAVTTAKCRMAPRIDVTQPDNICSLWKLAAAGGGGDGLLCALPESWVRQRRPTAPQSPINYRPVAQPASLASRKKAE